MSPASRLRGGWIFVGLLFLIVLCGLLPRRPEIVDLVSLQPLPELSLRPLHPILRPLCEPVAGPLMVVLGLPLGRLLAWLGWWAVGYVAVRTGRETWRNRRGQGLRHALGGLLGWYLPLALLPVPLYWLAWISKDVMKKMTPLGLPMAALVAVWIWTLWRSPSGQRWRTWRTRTGRFIGVLGWTLLGLALLISLQPLSSLGRRLVAPADVIVADFHAHSDRSRDSLVDAAERLALFHQHGIGVSAVTEHRSSPRNLDAPGFLEEHQEIARRQGYDMLMLPGREFTTHRLHLVLLGTVREYDTHDYVIRDTRGGLIISDDYDWERLIDDVHQEGGYVVVAHWWTPLTRGRVDWKRLVKAGVDGFEIAWAGDLAPRHLVRAWKEAGMLLLSGSDYHGYRKTLYSWNLLHRDSFAPGGTVLTELDPRQVLDRLFTLREVQPVGRAVYEPAVPVWLEPPAGAWGYFRALDLPGRASWIALTLLLWAIAGRRRRLKDPESRPLGQ